MLRSTVPVYKNISYSSRVLVELFKIIIIYSPFSLNNFFNFCRRSHDDQHIVPKCKLGILWNKCIGKVLDSPVLSTIFSLYSNSTQPQSQIIVLTPRF